MSWIATAYAALDLREWPENQSDIEVMLLSTEPREPFGLTGPYAELWLRLTGEPVDDDRLTPEEQVLVREYADAGIASDDPHHPARVRHVSRPWLSSPLHELVYGLAGSIAKEHGIDLVFIKGPALHRQGLRTREHSGDVDVWVDPARVAEMTERIQEWGWIHSRVLWEESSLHHSVTMRPGAWGCEIDLHRYMPGFALPDHLSFAALLDHAETLEFAGVPVPVPQAPAHAIVSALHLMRPQQGRTIDAGNDEEAVRELRAAGDEALVVAREMRAAAALRDILGEAFPGEKIDVDYDPPLNWRWRTEPDRVKRYLIMFRSTPLRAWPRTAFRAVWPDDSTALILDRYYGGTARSPLDARLKRLKRAILQQLRR